MSRVLVAAHGLLHLHHVIDRNAFGDGDDQVQPGVHAFENGVRGEGRGHKDGGDGGAGLAGGLGDGVEDGDLVAGVFEELAAFAGRDAGDDLRAVVKRELRVLRAKAAGDALDENFGLWVTRMDMVFWVDGSGWRSKQIFLLVFFFDASKQPYGKQILFPAGGLFGCDQGIQG
jgi:hypothetical protein